MSYHDRYFSCHPFPEEGDYLPLLRLIDNLAWGQARGKHGGVINLDFDFFRPLFDPYFSLFLCQM